jgi:hypothetical protein
MRFDYCISNPAFNISESNNIAGTGGNTTLYKTATKNDFVNRLKDDGTLVNITLKGIIPQLVNGVYKDYQVNWIHLMDNIDVWPYNTCIFSISKTNRVSQPKIVGGMAAKIFSPNPDDCFPFVYYSGSNNGMDYLYGDDKKYRVIRQLPGKNRDSLSYEYTDKEIELGPKFAFYVMESRKSYTVTDERVYGGTICYIPCDTLEQADKLKLFTEVNPFFKEYVSRMKLRGHAFGLRNIKKFDLSQIQTGLECPVEWNITDQDMMPSTKLVNDITEDRDRVKALGEVFTPTSLVDYVLDLIEQDDNTAFTESSKTFIDSMCGDGQFLTRILAKKVGNNIPANLALTNIYGIELSEENVKVCIARLNQNNGNIVCGDSLKVVKEQTPKKVKNKPKPINIDHLVN